MHHAVHNELVCIANQLIVLRFYAVKFKYFISTLFRPESLSMCETEHGLYKS